MPSYYKTIRAFEIVGVFCMGTISICVVWTYPATIYSSLEPGEFFCSHISVSNILKNRPSFFISTDVKIGLHDSPLSPF